jgi:hypothetical protein
MLPANREDMCQRQSQCDFHIRLDSNNDRAALVLLVSSYIPRRRQFGVAVVIAVETPRERRG